MDLVILGDSDMFIMLKNTYVIVILVFILYFIENGLPMN